MMISKVPVQGFSSNSIHKSPSCVGFVGAASDPRFINKTERHSHVTSSVEMAFKKLADYRLGNNLSEYYGVTKDNVNVALRETALGKSANLTLSNGHFEDKTYAYFDLERVAGKRSKITSPFMPAAKAAKIIKKVFENLRK